MSLGFSVKGIGHRVCRRGILHRFCGDISGILKGLHNWVKGGIYQSSQGFGGFTTFLMENRRKKT